MILATASTPAPAPTAAPAPAPAAPPRRESSPHAWPSTPWVTWERTADRWQQTNPMPIMQAPAFEPNADAVAQADFAFGGNFMAHGMLDVFAGATHGTFDTRDAAFGAAQALKGVHGIVGVFADGSKFAIRELLVSGADRREFPGNKHEVGAARPKPDRLKQLRDVGERHGSWGHGDFRSLSGVRFVSDDLLGLVSGPHRALRPEG